MAAEQSGHASEAKTLADASSSADCSQRLWPFAINPWMSSISSGALPVALAPGSALQSPLQVPYRSPTELLWSQNHIQHHIQRLDPLASTAREQTWARREPGSRRCRVSQHDLSLRVCARQMANCSGATEKSELRVPQDSLFAAAVVVDENGLTFAAQRGSQRGAGRSRRGPLGLLFTVRWDPAPWMDAMHVRRKMEKKKKRLGRDPDIVRCAGPREQQRRRRRHLIGHATSRARRLGIAAYCYPDRPRGGTTLALRGI